MTGVVADAIDGLDSATYLLSTGICLHKNESTSTTLAASATLTQTHPTHRVAGSGGAVTLDATTAIADGAADGVRLTLFGTSDTNTVTIQDGANTKMNGPVTLTSKACIEFEWDDTNSEWREVSRNV